MRWRRTLRVVMRTPHFWGNDYDVDLKLTLNGRPARVRFSTERRGARHAHVLLFHIPQFDGVPQRYRASQRLVALSAESDVNYPRLADAGAMAAYDLQMTYRLDSGVPMLYGGHPKEVQAARAAEPVLAPQAGAPVVYVASNAVPWRDNYVRELMEYVPVHALGDCLRNHDAPKFRARSSVADDASYGGKLPVLRRYPFTLAFENSASRDYVTEKAFHPLMCGSIPVIRGAPNARDFMPQPSAAVYADAFSGPAALGEHLRTLAADPAQLASHHAWREAAPSASFQRIMQIAAAVPRVRLAVKLLHGCGRECSCGRDPAAAGVDVRNVRFRRRWSLGKHPS